MSDLAKKYSLDGSKDYGGDLGYFTAPEMVAEFSKAAFALKVGEVSQPVKTDFGWHVIKIEDRKMGAAQPFDQVKSAIRNVLLRKKVAGNHGSSCAKPPRSMFLTRTSRNMRPTWRKSAEPCRTSKNGVVAQPPAEG